MPSFAEPAATPARRRHSTTMQRRKATAKIVHHLPTANDGIVAAQLNARDVDQPQAIQIHHAGTDSFCPQIRGHETGLKVVTKLDDLVGVNISFGG
jgi:hypothetical protein